MEEVTNSLGRQAFHMLTGKMLGSGIHRDVYECALIPDCVVKVEDKAKCFSNVVEWDLWQRFKDTKTVARWLAPCVDISSSGTILIQKRVKRMRIEEMPATMPDFLQDFKIENFGMLDGRLVCCDYAGMNISANIKRIKVEWWSHAGGRVEQ